MFDLQKRVKELLDERGWSQSRLAEESGIPKQYVQRICSGATKDPGISQVIAIAHGFGMDMNEFLEWE